MEAIIGWANDNWFNLCQSVGIVGGLFFTTITLRRDRKARRISDQLALNGLHHNVWDGADDNPKLARLFDSEIDFVSKPMTKTEERFLNRVIIHFFAGWQVAKDKGLSSFDSLNPDVKWFFSLPCREGHGMNQSTREIQLLFDTSRPASRTHNS